MTQEELLSVAEVIERLVKRFAEQGAEYERKMAEHRDSFVARTEADAKIIEGLRVTAKQDQDECDVLRPLVAEARTIIDGQRASIDDLRNRLNSLGIQAAKQAGEALGMVAGEGLLGAAQRVVKERDALRAELARLKSQTPKHPAKVGEWVKRLTPSPMTPAGGVAKVTDVFEVHGLAVKIERPDGLKGTWWAKSCEPCDPPNHDTEEGKAAAEAALKTEPVADEIKVGDVVEVVSNTGRNTWLADVGSVGTVVTVEEINDSISVYLDAVPGKKNALAGYVSFCDVRKVPT